MSKHPMIFMGQSSLTELHFFFMESKRETSEESIRNIEGKGMAELGDRGTFQERIETIGEKGGKQLTRKKKKQRVTCWETPEF
jgi:hypothetical protein